MKLQEAYLKVKPALGSIEYALAGLEVPLVLVLGHENRGVVKVAVTMLHKPHSVPEYLQPIANTIHTHAR